MRIRTIGIATLCAGLALAGGAGASEDKGGKLGTATGAAIGAAVAGPPGLVLGAGIGGFFGDKVQRAGMLDDTRAELAEARTRSRTLEGELADLQQRFAGVQGELAKSEQQVSRLQAREAAAAGLELVVPFRTGSSELNEGFGDHLAALAEVLDRYPGLHVQLDGHADPRGDAGYNRELSRARAEAVREVLIARGIHPARIKTVAHGAEESKAGEGDLDAYALERRVGIRVVLPGESSRVARSD